jgi:hypothetical protein
VKFDWVAVEDIDAKLVLEFSARYTRMEWALKSGGFLRSKKSGSRAKADWDEYAETIRGKLRGVPAAGAAIDLLTANPPREQRVDSGGELGWKVVDRREYKSEEGYLLRLVRTVRNNLFHGGLYAEPVGRMEEPARNRALLEACMVILNACVELSPEFKSKLTQQH